MAFLCVFFTNLPYFCASFNSPNWNKKSQEKEFEFQGGSKPTRRLTETRLRAKLFGAKILPQQQQVA